MLRLRFGLRRATVYGLLAWCGWALLTDVVWTFGPHQQMGEAAAAFTLPLLIPLARWRRGRRWRTFVSLWVACSVPAFGFLLFGQLIQPSHQESPSPDEKAAILLERLAEFQLEQAAMTAVALLTLLAAHRCPAPTVERHSYGVAASVVCITTLSVTVVSNLTVFAIRLLAPY